MKGTENVHRGQAIGHRLRALGAGTVVAAVVVSPWLFGSAEPWAYLAICLLLNVGLAAWLLSLACDPGARLRAPVVTLLLGAVLALVAVQTMRLPRPLVRRGSPLAASAQDGRDDLLPGVVAEELRPAAPGPGGSRASLSACAPATRRSLYLLVGCAAVFLVTANGFTRWRHLRAGAAAVVASCFAMAVLGVVHELSGDRAILWFHVPRFGGSIFGPFTNRNHFAAHMNMAFGVGLGLLLAATGTRRLPGEVSWRGGWLG
jgi:hypothetical protein